MNRWHMARKARFNDWPQANGRVPRWVGVWRYLGFDGGVWNQLSHDDEEKMFIARIRQEVNARDSETAEFQAAIQDLRSRLARDDSSRLAAASLRSLYLPPDSTPSDKS